MDGSKLRRALAQCAEHSTIFAWGNFFSVSLIGGALAVVMISREEPQILAWKFEALCNAMLSLLCAALAWFVSKAIHYVARHFLYKYWRFFRKIMSGCSDQMQKKRDSLCKWTLISVSGAAAVFCSFYWKQCEPLHSFMQWAFSASWFMSLVVLWSLLSFVRFYLVRNDKKSILLWYFGVAPVICFWTLAEAESFNWKSLEGVFWCILAGGVIMIPVLKSGYREERPAQMDKIGRRLLYRRTGGRIREYIGRQLKRGVSMAVCGPWGSGKSHFIDYLVTTLQKEYSLENQDEEENNLNEIYLGRFEVCRVDLWQSKDKEAMWNDIAVALVGAISGRNISVVNHFRTFWVNVCQTVHVPFMPLIESVVQLLSTGVDSKVTGGEILEKRILETGHAYILVLDNVDRCDRGKVDALFPLIERLKGIKGLVTICGIAQEELGRVSYNNTEQGMNLSETFTKVFDVILPIPTVSQKYAKSYMQYLLSQYRNSSPYLHEWLDKQELLFDTPRQIQNIVAHLALIDRCYFTRLSSQIWSGLSRRLRIRKISAAFYMATMRVIFPTFVSIIEKSDSPKQVLRKSMKILHIVRQEENAGSKLERVEDDNVIIKNESGDETRNAAEEIGYTRQQVENIKLVCERYAQSYLFESLIKSLCRLPESYLQFAVKQEYLNITNLTSRECKDVLRQYKEQKKPLLDMIREKFSAEYMEIDELNLYKDVFYYALNSLRNEECKQLVYQCVEKDVTDADGVAASYLNSPLLLFSLLNVSLNEIEASFEKLNSIVSQNAGTRVGLLLKVLPKMALEPLKTVLCAIWKSENFSSRMSESDFGDADVYSEYRRLVMRLSRTQKPEIIKSIVNLLCSYFANSLCENINGYVDELIEPVNVFQCLWKDYEIELKKGIEQRIKQGVDDDFWAGEAVANLLEVLHHILEDKREEVNAYRVNEKFADSWIFLMQQCKTGVKIKTDSYSGRVKQELELFLQRELKRLNEAYSLEPDGDDKKQFLVKIVEFKHLLDYIERLETVSDIVE